MRELQQLLNPNTGGPQDFNDGPGPEGVVFFEFEVASLAGAGVVGPDLAGEGSVAGGGADQRLPGCGERLSRLGLAGCLQQRVDSFAVLIDVAHQRRQNGQPFPGAGLTRIFCVWALSTTKGARVNRSHTASRL